MDTVTLTIGSLFSGIGGLELGLERAGLGPVKWQVEIDPFCRSVLAQHWPNAERFEDVREAGSELSAVDLICGGFPCQDISLAGTGCGLAGERSGLWAEFARIIRLVRPRFVVVENVSALLARGLGDVLGDLAASGYDALWDCIPAQAVGAPHRRDRLFLVAWRVSNAERDGIRQQPERGGGSAQPTHSGNPFAQHVGPSMADGDGGRRKGERQPHRQPEHQGASWRDVDGCCGADLGDTSGQGSQGPSWSAHEGRPRPVAGRAWPPSPDDLHAWGGVQAESQPSICRLADGVPARLVRRRDRLKALGNAVVPQVAEVIGRVVLQLARDASQPMEVAGE